MKNETSLPDRRWIGKTLEITETGVFNILEGSELRGIELLEGQKVKVVGTQKGNWLLCILQDKAEFQRVPGVQMSEFETAWEEKQHGPYGDVHSSKGIIIGISLNFDRDRFVVVEDSTPNL